MTGRRPPRLLVKTMTVTFAGVVALIAIVFVVVYVTVRDQVRQAVTANLESSQRLVSAVETRRQRELRAQAANLAENPTLKASLDTYAAEAATGDATARAQLLTTISRELDKVASRFDSDAIVLLDAKRQTIAAAGPFADRWPVGRSVSLAAAGRDPEQVDGVMELGQTTFRVATVPLLLDDGGVVGTLGLATSLDRRYAEDLKGLSRADTAIIRSGLLIASTLSPEGGRELESAVARMKTADGTLELGGESFAIRRLAQVDDTSVFALASIDASSRAAIREAARSLGLVAIGAIGLALVGSVTLAHRVTEPIGRLSASLAQIARSRDVTAQLPVTGSSRELDVLTETFNALMASLAAAEAQTEGAYAGAIRALAAALDARDPYTAGHSERVSVLSVGIGRVLGISADELEVIRLGALLHDIGKIGVPDEVLRKPGPLSTAEYDLIKQHPGLGARILRPVPFLAPHLSIVELHHERPDGRGYPHGLRGDDIPLAARVVHVADAYDAMTSARAYRRALPPNEALRELWRCSGTEFEAEIVGALTTALPGVVNSASRPVLVEMRSA